MIGQLYESNYKQILTTNQQPLYSSRKIMFADSESSMFAGTLSFPGNYYIELHVKYYHKH